MLNIRKKKNNSIYWGDSNSYDFGTILIFYERNHVFFDNELLPPGEVIQEWYSIGNYQATRKITPLPLLKKNQTYHLILDMIPTPTLSIFTKIIFYNRYGDVVDYKVTKSNELFFDYPKNAYSYKIQLISAGLTALEFHHLEIKEVNTYDNES